MAATKGGLLKSVAIPFKRKGGQHPDNVCNVLQYANTMLQTVTCAVSASPLKYNIKERRQIVKDAEYHKITIKL